MQSRIFQMRRANGWTQEQLAARSGLGQPVVSSAERSQRPTRITVGTAIALAKAFDVPIEEIVRAD